MASTTLGRLGSRLGLWNSGLEEGENSAEAALREIEDDVSGFQGDTVDANPAPADSSTPSGPVKVTSPPDQKVEERLDSLLAGEDNPPAGIFLKVVDAMLENGMEFPVAISAATAAVRATDGFAKETVFSALQGTVEALVTERDRFHDLIAKQSRLFEAKATTALSEIGERRNRLNDEMERLQRELEDLLAEEQQALAESEANKNRLEATLGGFETAYTERHKRVTRVLAALNPTSSK